MKQLRGIIIDDENGSIKNLSLYLSTFLPELNIVATGNTKNDFIKIAAVYNFDIAFLDVQLFNENIFDILPLIGEITFKIIFITAYNDYAIKAIKANAFDYLLKPIEKHELLDTINKIKTSFFPKLLHNTDEETKREKDNSVKKIVLKDADKVYIVNADDVLFFKANGVYTTIFFTANGSCKSIIISKPINQLEKDYYYDRFFRIHKSYIINIDKIAFIEKKYGFTVKLINETVVPVAKRRVHNFLNFIK